MSAVGPSRHIAAPRDLGRFSNRPVGVKHFQTTHYYSVDVTRKLALLFGIGTKALPSWDPDEAEQSLPRPHRVTAGPGDRNPSIVSQGHHLGGTRMFSYRILF
jgi:hypothetical protein